MSPTNFQRFALTSTRETPGGNLKQKKLKIMNFRLEEILWKRNFC